MTVHDIISIKYMKKSAIKIYKTPSGATSIEVKLEDETVWLNQYQLEELFQTDRTTITKHILNIYKTKELIKKSTCAKFAQVRKEGVREVKRKINFYNLDVIIAVGYRVNSKRGTQFRIWANQLIKEFLIKGYVLNQQKLQNQNKQLLELKKTIHILGNVVLNKELSNDESQGLFA